MRKLCVGVAVVLLLTACNSNKALFQKARLATAQGKYEQAIALYTRLVKQEPNHFAAYLNRGILWEQRKTKNDKEKQQYLLNAEHDYQRAMELEPNVAEPYNNLGALYIDTNRYIDAVGVLTDALNLNTNYFTARVNRAIAYYRSGRTLDALIDFNKAAQLRPRDPLLLLNRALTYFDMGEYESAVRDLTVLIALNPKDARAYLERARSLMRLDYPADAYADLETAVSIKPTYALAYYYMGDLMFRKGEVDRALGLLQESKKWADKYAPTYELMGDMLAMSDPISATANYMAARKLDPARAAHYEAKMRAMRTEKGREQVQTRRFYSEP